MKNSFKKYEPEGHQRTLKNCKPANTTYEVVSMTKKKPDNHPKDTIPRRDLYNIRQNAHYNADGKAEPDNNIFWEERSNPLSSKGN